MCIETLVLRCTNFSCVVWWDYLHIYLSVLSLYCPVSSFSIRITCMHHLMELTFVIKDMFQQLMFWINFCSHKHQIYSRAYIDFKKPDDVVEFAEFFDGHVFVNEKGNKLILLFCFFSSSYLLAACGMCFTTPLWYVLLFYATVDVV